MTKISLNLFTLFLILIYSQLAITQEDSIQIRLSAILVQDKSEAELILQKLNQGTDFADLAQEYSIGPGKDRSGDLGYFSPDDLIQELKTIVINLPIGKYSDIVKTNQGFFILLKTDERSVSESIDEDNLLYLLEKGIYEFNRENYHQALRILKEAEVIGPDNQEVLYFLGCTYEELGIELGKKMIKVSLPLIQKSSLYFKKVIEIDPTYEVEILEQDPYFKISSLWGSLALAYLHDGNLDSAIWAFREGEKEGGYFPAIMEYSKNILNSCEKDAILFTDGYEEIFPIWFLQLVENHHPDIMVVNLRLLEADWYIKLLKKNNTLGLANISSDLADNQPDYLEDISYQILSKFIKSNQGKRPIYFSVTIDQVALEPYFDSLTLEGLVYHMFTKPVKQLSSELLEQNCIEVYTYTAVNDEHLNYIPELVSLYQNYRYNFIDLASTFNKQDSVLEILNIMDLKIPEKAVPYQPDVLDYKGMVYRNNYLYKEAVLSYRKVIEIDPDYPEVHYNLGLIYIDLRDIESAHKEYKILRIVDPDLAKDLKKRLRSKITIVISGGWNFPTGKVYNIGGQVHFPPVHATEIYKQGVVLGFGAGGILPFNPYFMLEADFKIRLSPLTSHGQELANQTRDDDKEVDILYTSLDLFVGKNFIGGDVTRSRFRPFTGISIGWIGLLLDVGEEEEETEADHGIGVAFKSGIDWLAGRSRKFFIRFGVHYQILTSGVNIPQDLIFFIGIGFPGISIN